MAGGSMKLLQRYRYGTTKNSNLILAMKHILTITIIYYYNLIIRR